MSVKISADKGMTGFLFGHYNDLMGSEVTHSNVFSEDSGRRIRNNRMEKFFGGFFVHIMYLRYIVITRQILSLIKGKNMMIRDMCFDSAAA